MADRITNLLQGIKYQEQWNVTRPPIVQQNLQRPAKSQTLIPSSGRKSHLDDLQWHDRHYENTEVSPHFLPRQKATTEPFHSPPAGYDHTIMDVPSYFPQPYGLASFVHEQYQEGPQMRPVQIRTANTDFWNPDNSGESLRPYKPIKTQINDTPCPRPVAIRPTAIVKGYPMVQNIQLIAPADILPEQYVSIFPHVVFNAVQSKCMPVLLQTNDNFVLSAPTGSGKTVIFELAICKTMIDTPSLGHKVVYLAPTKALCSERQRDWAKKFAKLGMNVEEITGDSENNSLKAVQRSNIIVTTPEKWGSITREWKDHRKLVALIKLVMIDEVHMLGGDRGTVIEVIVSRMKSIGDVRFIALSATIPNIQDIATWLTKSVNQPCSPALLEVFGEEFRPVKIDRFIEGFNHENMNDHAFDNFLTKKIPQIVLAHARHKQMLIFCMTKKSCEDTVAVLAQLFDESSNTMKPWRYPRQSLGFKNQFLNKYAPAGLAVHHSKLDSEDRIKIEKAFEAGDLGIICCTSTLAVGVNLPCHTVIIKGTVGYDGSKATELSDLDVLQMIGRAGRPQFGNSAKCIILTRSRQVDSYRNMKTSTQVLESRLHLDLLEHVNAEIGLGTITDQESACKWLAGTFLYVRMKVNPEYYEDKESCITSNLNTNVTRICNTAINLLAEQDLLEETPRLIATPFGIAMSKYSVSYETMKLILGLPQNSNIKDVLYCLCSAHELREIPFYAKERSFFRERNAHGSIRFKCKGDITQLYQKISLIVQSVLNDITETDRSAKSKKSTDFSFLADQWIIFRVLKRLVRCVVDCQSHLKDSIGLNSALLLSRSLEASVWDDGALILRQIDKVGAVMMCNLIKKNITTIDEFINASQHDIEAAGGKGPPFGINLIGQAKMFPKMAISLSMSGKPIVQRNAPITVKCVVIVKLVNEKKVNVFKKQSLELTILADTTDGRIMKFERIFFDKIDHISGYKMSFDATLTKDEQRIRCFVACASLAGTEKVAIINPNIQPSVFRDMNVPDLTNFNLSSRLHNSDQTLKQKKTRVLEDSQSCFTTAKRLLSETSETLEAIDMSTLEEVADNTDFGDDYDLTCTLKPNNDYKVIESSKSLEQEIKSVDKSDTDRLPNGRLKCNHECSGKSKCSHVCCKDGLKGARRKRPTAPNTNFTIESDKSKDVDLGRGESEVPYMSETITKPVAVRIKTISDSNIEEIDLSQKSPPRKKAKIEIKLSTLNGIGARSMQDGVVKAVSVRHQDRVHEQTFSDGFDDLDDFIDLDDVDECLVSNTQEPTKSSTLQVDVEAQLGNTLGEKAVDSIIPFLHQPGLLQPTFTSDDFRDDDIFSSKDPVNSEDEYEGHEISLTDLTSDKNDLYKNSENQIEKPQNIAVVNSVEEKGEEEEEEGEYDRVEMKSFLAREFGDFVRLV